MNNTAVQPLDVTVTMASSSTSDLLISGTGIMLALLAFAMFIGFFVTWIIAFVQVIKRTDLKESRILWILLLFVVGPLGVLLYAFLENRKTFGYWTLACYIGLPIIMVCFVLLMAVMA